MRLVWKSPLSSAYERLSHAPPQNIRLNSLSSVWLQMLLKHFWKNKFRLLTAFALIVWSRANFVLFGSKRDYLPTSNNPQNWNLKSKSKSRVNFQLRRLYKDFTSKNVEAVRIAGLFTTMINLHSSSSDSKGTVPPSSNIKEYIARMEQEGVARVKMFLVITVAYLIFWGPLFLVTLVNWSWEWKDAKKSMSHEVI